MKLSRTRHSFIALAVALSLNVAQPAYAADNAPPEMRDKDILGFLQEVISWRNAITEGELTPGNARAALIKDSLSHNSQAALKSCFDFAHAESAVLEATQVQPGAEEKGQDNRHITLTRRMEDTRQHIEQLEEQLKTAKAGTSQHEKIVGELKVEKAHMELMQSFATFFRNTDNNDTGLTGAINKLSDSILGELNEQPVNAAPAKNDNAKDAAGKDKDPAADSASGDNILDITSDIITLMRKKKTIDALIGQTADVKEANQKIIGILRVSLQDAMKEGYALADAPVAPGRKTLQEHRRALDAWNEKYKKLSAAVLPLGQINTYLDASTADLKEWQSILSQQWDKIFYHFAIKLAILCISLLIPFVFLEAAHRAIKRYVHDSNRVRQLNVVRQSVFVTLLALVIFLNFFTEFGSLATYAGLLTAGLAVALQTVLVSLTAHFFFFGRFGVRAGDRVTIAGVTGDVVQVGMLRIYLMELIGEKDALRPSGKIVAFPNSVLFNATAFSKQVAGTNYTWDDLKFSLDPATDFALANKKIMDVVNSVYAEYKDVIERQHAVLERSTNLAVSVPSPRSEIAVKETGLICDVHYPVIIENAPKIYEKMINRLMKAFETDKDFKMMLTSPIKIVAA